MSLHTRGETRSIVLGSLRGLAILGVMLVHSSHEFPGLGSWTETFATGERGVQLFFMLSAITLVTSWKRRREEAPIQRFFVRRFFRVAPMFYLAIVIYWLIDGYAPRSSAPHGIGPTEYVLSFLFLSEWLPNSINSIVPGGWSIGVEMSFYAIFPWLVTSIRNTRQAALACVGAAVAGVTLSFGLYKIMQADAGSNTIDQIRFFLFYWLPVQMPVFLMGFAAYYALQGPTLLNIMRNPRQRQFVGTGLVVLSCLMVATLVCFHLPVINVYLFGLLFAALFVGLEFMPFRGLVNPVMDHIGTVSYSAYFVHFLVVRSLWPYVVPRLPLG